MEKLPGRRIGVCTFTILMLTAQGVVTGQEPTDSLYTRKQLFPIDPKAYLLGHFRPDTTTDFVRLPADIAGEREAYMRTEAASALARMLRAAEEDGIQLRVISATRTFRRQKMIWEGKFSGTRLSMGRNLAETYPDTLERCRAILEYSSAPGISRHHWGTEVDFNRTDPAYWRQGEGLAALHWLQENASRYGYEMAYPIGRERGYRYEPWHWSYRPISRPLLRNYFHRLVRDADLQGFSGAEALRDLPWREWYVDSVGEGLR